MHELLRLGLRHTETSHGAVDARGRFLAIDDVGAGWLGVTADEIVGRAPWELGGTLREAEWPATWARIVDQGRWSILGTAVGEHGELVRLTVQFELVPAGPERAAYAFVTTIRRSSSELASEPESQARLNRAVAFIEDPLMDWNPVTGQIALNPAAAALMGVEPGGELSDEAMRHGLWPDALPEVDESLRALIAGERRRFEWVQRIERSGQPVCHVLLRFLVVAKGTDGRARQIVVHGVDISTRRRAVAEAREKRTLFTAVAHTSTAAIVIVDDDGRIVFANPRAEAVLGLSRSALVERTYDDPAWRSTAPDGAPWPSEQLPFARVMATAAPVYGIEHAIEWPDGSRRQLSVNGEPLFDDAGHVARVLFCVEDITERVAAAEQLARSEKRLRDVLDRLPVAVHLTDGEGRIQLWNRAAGELLMGNPDDLGRRRLNTEPWDMVDEAGAPVRPSLFPASRALTEKRPIRGAIVGVLAPGTTERRWFMADASPRLDADGRVLDVVTQIMEISDQRRLEQKLRDARRLEAVGRLAGGVAHDFNNLLTVVLSSADTLGVGLPLDDELQVEVGEIRQAAARGAALVRALLGCAGRQFRKPQTVRIPALVGGIWRRWSRRAGSGIEARIEINDTMPEVFLDPDQFEQVFEALLDNAGDAMGGLGRLRITLSEVTLAADDSAWPELDARIYVCLAVADSGQGVPPEAVSHMFEPFFSTRARGPGHGLGLANAHGIVHQNGGGIRLADNGPAGAVFEVLWPMTPPEERAVGPGSPALPTQSDLRRTGVGRTMGQNPTTRKV